MDFSLILLYDFISLRGLCCMPFSITQAIVTCLPILMTSEVNIFIILQNNIRPYSSLL